MVSVQYATRDEFLRELAKETNIHAGVVRMCVHTHDFEFEGTDAEYSQVYVKASYIAHMRDGSKELRELYEYCGDDNGDDLEGTTNSQDLTECLTRTLSLWGLDVRGGEYA